MSQDDEAAATLRGARQRGHAPPERPSLFAEFDQDHVEDIEPHRVRLLSTLESQRGRTRRPRHRRVASGTGSAWTTRALVGVMGLGMLIVLFSFIEVIRRPPPAVVAPTAAPVVAPVAARSEAPKARPPVEIQAAEIIDTAPPAAAPSPTPAPTATVTPTASPTATLLATAAADVARLNAEPTGRKPPRAAERREPRPRSDDVALLEAMFTHTGQTGNLREPRKTAGPSSGPAQAPDAAPTTTSASATEALRLCGGASSADAAVCRARVCVQHPTTPACHVAAR